MKSKALLTNFRSQFNWISNQLKKDFDDGIFFKKEKAEQDFVFLKNQIKEEKKKELLLFFVEKNITEKGIKRLLNTIRVANNRSKDEYVLQVPLKGEAKAKLDKIIMLSGLTQVELINRLIINDRIKKYSKDK